MTHGKNICRQLKAVRRRIAEENGIPLEMEECTYQGECRGTCPRCEAEVRYLEESLANRLRLGKATTVAGIALALSGTAAAQAVDFGTPLQQDGHTVNQPQGTGTLKGQVLDSKTQEPVPFAPVTVYQDGKLVKVVNTDIDGIYTIKSLPSGEYTIVVRMLGFHRFAQDGVYVKPVGFTVCSLSINADTTAIIEGSIPVIESFPLMGEVQVELPGTPASQAEPTPLPQPVEDGPAHSNPTLQPVEDKGMGAIVR